MTTIIRMRLDKKTKTITTWYLGKKLEGITDAFERIKNPEHAKLYMKGYRRLSKYADANVGYMTGYYDAKTMRELQKRFGVGHPIFGRSVPSAKEALEAGTKTGKKSKHDKAARS